MKKNRERNAESGVSQTGTESGMRSGPTDQATDRYDFFLSNGNGSTNNLHHFKSQMRPGRCVIDDGKEIDEYETLKE